MGSTFGFHSVSSLYPSGLGALVFFFLMIFSLSLLFQGSFVTLSRDALSELA